MLISHLALQGNQHWLLQALEYDTPWTLETHESISLCIHEAEEPRGHREDKVKVGNLILIKSLHYQINKERQRVLQLHYTWWVREKALTYQLHCKPWVTMTTLATRWISYYWQATLIPPLYISAWETLTISGQGEREVRVTKVSTFLSTG